MIPRISPARFLPVPTSTSVPTMLRTIWWQKALASIQKWRTSPPSPPSSQQASVTRRTSDTDGSGRRQNEAKSCSPMSGSAPSRSRSRSSPSSTCHARPAQERVGRRRGQQRVAVAPSEGRAASIEVGRSDRRVSHRDRGPEQTVQRPLQPFEFQTVRRRIEGHDLTASVHPGVGAAGTGELDRVAQDLLDGRRQLPADRPHALVGREPPEPRAVVGDGHPDARSPRRETASHDQTSSIRAMSALSPWRGPSLRMRVYPPLRSV